MKKSPSGADPEPIEAATVPTGADEEEPRIDLSALDPARDALGWERRIHSIAARAVAARRARLTVSRQLYHWARPAIALGMAAAAASWILALSRPVSVEGGDEQPTEEPAYAIARWAATGELPSTSNILDALGGNDGTR